MTVPHLSRVTKLSAGLARIDEERAHVLADRDAAIVAALEEGATWVQVQGVSGLSPRGLQLAVRRHHARTQNGE